MTMAIIEQIDWTHWILRLVAYIIDSIIFGIITWALGLFLPLGWLSGTLVWGALQWLYFTFFDVYMSATVGKRLLDIQVQAVTGGRVTFDKALVRNLSKIIPPLLIIDWIVGVVTPGDKRQKFLDRTAGVTFVRPTEGYSAYTSASSPPPPPPQA